MIRGNLLLILKHVFLFQVHYPQACMIPHAFATVEIMS